MIIITVSYQDKKQYSNKNSTDMRPVACTDNVKGFKICNYP